MASIRWRVVGAALALVVLALTLRGISEHANPPVVNDYRAATDVLLGHASASDAFAVELPDERAGVEYYVDRASTSLHRPRPCYPAQPWGAIAPSSGPRPADVDAAVLACAAGAPHLWVVHRVHDTGIQRPLALAPSWHRIDEWSRDQVVVDEWGRGPA